MRRRLTIALVALVAGSLVLTGVGVLVIARANARSQATDQLLAQAHTFARAASEISSRPVLRVVARMLDLEDASIVVVGPGGALAGAPPGDLSASDIAPARLAGGQTVTGFRGDEAFVAVPVTLDTPFILRFEARGGTAAVVLTRRVDSFAPGWLYLFLVGGVTLLAAAVVAAWLSRRFTRPIVEASSATSRIAQGELGTRLPGGSHVAELESLAGSINAMAAGLETARERETQLLLSVSHDLRTPLTSIRGYAEAIEEGVADDPAAAARVIAAESRRLERLVADLLDLAKLKGDHLSLRLETVDVAAVAAGTLESFRPVASARGVALSFSGDPSPARADADRLAQVIGNLVQNAVAHAGGNVRVDVRPELGSVAVVVTDDGPGIPPEHLSKVFDRFYQVDRGGAARKGSGLGLSIVAELVRAMGGTVVAHSPVVAQGGTQMVVRLRAPADGPLRQS